jgi:transposase InsO family protein
VPPPVPDDHALAIAAFRHRCLVEVLEANDEELAPLLKAQARQPRTDPAGRARTVSVRTLARWLAAYRRGGLLALCPQRRTDQGTLRAIPPDVFARAQALRRQKPARPTKTILDILVRQQHVPPHAIARSTLDRHLARHGLSRHLLRSLGQQTFRRIETTTPFELVVADFHHGPYVRTADGTLRRALLGAHIDHFSRYVPEGRYFLHEDYAALRFGFRRLLTAFGLPVTYYVDRGGAFQATRFHAACDTLGIRLVHSAPYQSECRGVVERFNRTVKEQFETEVRGREEPPTLDELNAYFEAWLAERYHRDGHSETGEAPRERFQRTALLRPAPDLTQVDELLRLRERRRVHKKWSTVEVLATRYVVDPALRGRKVDVLYDPFTPESVLIVFDGRVIQRASPQQPGARHPRPLRPRPRDRPPITWPSCAPTTSAAPSTSSPPSGCAPSPPRPNSRWTTSSRSSPRAVVRRSPRPNGPARPGAGASCGPSIPTRRARRWPRPSATSAPACTWTSTSTPSPPTWCADAPP